MKAVVSPQKCPSIDDKAIAIMDGPPVQFLVISRREQWMRSYSSTAGAIKKSR